MYQINQAAEGVIFTTVFKKCDRQCCHLWYPGYVRTVENKCLENAFKALYFGVFVLKEN